MTLGVNRPSLDLLLLVPLNESDSVEDEALELKASSIEVLPKMLAMSGRVKRSEMSVMSTQKLMMMIITTLQL